MPSSMPCPGGSLTIEPLTASAFSPFGTVIANPLPDNATVTPDSLPPSATLANQGSAVKITDISTITNEYAAAPSQTPARSAMSMFICLPRELRSVAGSGASLFDIKILERHPFTSQTFTPLGLGPDDLESYYLVIVAPNAASSAAIADVSLAQGSGSWTEQFMVTSKAPTNPPDLSRVRAFLARGSQAVTYAAGTWHAPMVVLGKKPITFVVVQYVNGVADEDCQEVELVSEEAEGGLHVAVELPPVTRDLKAKI